MDNIPYAQESRVTVSAEAGPFPQMSSILIRHTQSKLRGGKTDGHNVNLPNIMAHSRDTPNSHPAMLQMAVQIAITFCKSQWDDLYYGWCWQFTATVTDVVQGNIESGVIDSTMVTGMITGIMGYRRALIKTVEQRSQIVPQLWMRSIITTECSKVVSRYHARLPLSILTIGMIGPQNWIIVRSGSRQCQLQSIWSNKSTKIDPQQANTDVPIRWYTKRVFRNTMEMISMSIVLQILRIHGTTGGWTIWALSGDQRIQHVLMAHGGSIEVSYPYIGMDDIWLSDSTNWVWQACDSLSEPIHTFGGSCGGRTVRASESVSSCKAFDFWLCNPRVSGRGGCGPARQLGMPRECTWITAREQACSEGGGGLPDIPILRANAFDDLLASEVVVWTSFLRVGDSTGLLGASATTLASFRNTRVFRTALMALTEPRTYWRTVTRYPSPWRRVALHSISKMYFSHWKPPGVSERMWSVNLDVSKSGVSDPNVFYGLTAHVLATDHTQKHASARSRVVYYPAHNLNFRSCPATTQPWDEWGAQIQRLTERMRFAKPNMHTAQVLNHLSALLLQHMAYHIERCETDLEEHSQGVQHMTRSSCWLQKRRNQLLGFVRL